MPALLLLLLAGGVVYAIASRKPKYALSADCQLNELTGMEPDAVQKWLQDHLAKAWETAAEGKGAVKFKGPPLPPEFMQEILDCQANLGAELCNYNEATGLITYPVESDDPVEVGMYLYQQLAHPDCSVITFGEWGVDTSIEWPSAAAECLFLQMVVMSKMALALEYGTDDETYQVTPEELAEIGIKCAVAETASAAFQPTQTFEAQQAPLPLPEPLPLPLPPGHGYGVQGPPSIDYRRMAHDANRGLLHPGRILSGEVFR